MEGKAALECECLMNMGDQEVIIGEPTAPPQTVDDSASVKVRALHTESATRLA